MEVTHEDRAALRRYFTGRDPDRVPPEVRRRLKALGLIRNFGSTCTRRKWDILYVIPLYALTAEGVRVIDDIILNGE